MKSGRIKTVLLAFLLAITLPALANEAAPKAALPNAEDPVIEQRLVNLAEDLRCLVCQNESLAGSRSDLAEDLRRELRTLIKEGKTDAEVREFMVSRYGDFVLYRPPLKPTTWLLWVGPFVLMIAGVAALIAYLRRRGREMKDAPLSDEENQRAEALLKEEKS